MYNGIGLQTPRGSGTNGYVQRNMSFVPRRREKVNYRTEEDIKMLDALANKKPNEGILAHEKKRLIELKCLEVQDLMEEQGYPEDEIDAKVALFRKMLMEKEGGLEREIPKNEFGKPIVKESHQMAEANQEKNMKMREALGISQYFVEGSSLDPTRKEKEAAAAEEAKKKYTLVPDSSSSSPERPAEKEKEKKRKKKKSHSSRERLDAPSIKKKKSSKKHKKDRSVSPEFQKKKRSKLLLKDKVKHKSKKHHNRSSSSSSTDSSSAADDESSSRSSSLSSLSDAHSDSSSHKKHSSKADKSHKMHKKRSSSSESVRYSKESRSRKDLYEAKKTKRKKKISRSSSSSSEDDSSPQQYYRLEPVLLKSKSKHKKSRQFIEVPKKSTFELKKYDKKKRDYRSSSSSLSDDETVKHDSKRQKYSISPNILKASKHAFRSESNHKKSEYKTKKHHKELNSSSRGRGSSPLKSSSKNMLGERSDSSRKSKDNISAHAVRDKKNVYKESLSPERQERIDVIHSKKLQQSLKAKKKLELSKKHKKNSISPKRKHLRKNSPHSKWKEADSPKKIIKRYDSDSPKRSSKKDYTKAHKKRNDSCSSNNHKHSRKQNDSDYFMHHRKTTDYTNKRKEPNSPLQKCHESNSPVRQGKRKCSPPRRHHRKEKASKWYQRRNDSGSSADDSKNHPSESPDRYNDNSRESLSEQSGYSPGGRASFSPLEKKFAARSPDVSPPPFKSKKHILNDSPSTSSHFYSKENNSSLKLPSEKEITKLVPKQFDHIDVNKHSNSPTKNNNDCRGNKTSESDSPILKKSDHQSRSHSRNSKQRSKLFDRSRSSSTQSDQSSQRVKEKKFKIQKCKKQLNENDSDFHSLCSENQSGSSSKCQAEVLNKKTFSPKSPPNTPPKSLSNNKSPTVNVNSESDKIVFNIRSINLPLTLPENKDTECSKSILEKKGVNMFDTKKDITDSQKSSLLSDCKDNSMKIFPSKNVGDPKEVSKSPTSLSSGLNKSDKKKSSSHKTVEKKRSRSRSSSGAGSSGSGSDRSSRSHSRSYRSKSYSKSPSKSYSKSPTPRRKKSCSKSMSKSRSKSFSRSRSKSYSRSLSGSVDSRSRSRSYSSRSRSRSIARSPSIPRRRGSPSFLDKRRITS